MLRTADTPGNVRGSALSSLTASTVSQPQYRNTARTTPAASWLPVTWVVKNQLSLRGAKPTGCET